MRTECTAKAEILNSISSEKAYVYMVRCKNNSLYTGWTTDLERRVKEHNNGTGSKYTRANRPVELVYFEEMKDKLEATKREYEIKQLPKAKKELLISQHQFKLMAP
ncbi:GIY-YIG nuclease family protein [Proteiniborus sp. MB09-C3]|uniref:GIY-YIG nuclease family protein n=1 Tax=Proteiniborus sp. MB09-C3 TaxID=3050072 RepID=UPI002552DE74|nr:GIY-YIG nuclease family protein [Proteiniborus sp. MB09-C3]WIV10641.1 GIY-YIG nuclease family protein [Proteiniborus sp. MB09-C3]